MDLQFISMIKRQRNKMKIPFKYFPFPLKGLTTLDLNYLPFFPECCLAITSLCCAVRNGVGHWLYEIRLFHFMDKTVLQAINCIKIFCKLGCILVFMQGTD